MRAGALGIAYLVVGILVCNGCHHSDSPAEPDRPAAVQRPIPPDSPLAQVKVDMDERQVVDLIGRPTDMGGHVTGKAFIPFYYGGDTHEVVAHYKKMGRVTYAPSSAFSGTLRVISVEYDPNESGYN